MTMTAKALVREFRITKGTDKVILADPNPEMTPSEVMLFYSGQYPELTNGSVSNPEVKATKMIYDFSTTVGKKG